jgi:hypothetical protein
MSSAIEQLPTELVEFIASYLDATDYGCFRLASQSLQAASFAQFTKRYVARLSISLEPPKLRKFTRLLWRKPLAKAINHLVIDMDDHGEYHLEKTFGEINGQPVPDTVLETEHLKDAIVHALNEKARLYSDIARSDGESTVLVDMLAQTLEKCKKLQGIRFYFNGHYIAAPPPMYESSVDIFQATCFKITLDAVIKSGINLRYFSTVEDGSLPEDDCSIIPYTSFLLPIPYLLQLKEAFTELKSICICINIVLRGFARIPGWEHGISQFFSTATNLEHLSLYLATEMSMAITSVAVVRSLTTTTSFHKLRSFRLGGAKFEENDLALFSQNHSASLRELVFADVMLTTGTWKSLLRIFRDVLELERFRLYWPWEGDPPCLVTCPGYSNPLDFSTAATNPKATRNLKEALTFLIENHTVNDEPL